MSPETEKRSWYKSPQTYQEEIKKRLSGTFMGLHIYLSRMEALCEETDDPESIELAKKATMHTLSAIRKIRTNLNVPYDWPGEDDDD